MIGTHLRPSLKSNFLETLNEYELTVKSGERVIYKNWRHGEKSKYYTTIMLQRNVTIKQYKWEYNSTKN